MIGFISIFLFRFIKKRNFESLLISQTLITSIIAISLISMSCNMFNWLWIYLGIILIGSLMIFIIKSLLDKDLDENIINSQSFVYEFEKEFNVPIKIIDKQRIKAFHYRKKIFLSVGLLEKLEKEEIKAVIAHEIYHLKYSPNKIISSLLAISSLTFKRYSDEKHADKYAVKITGMNNFVNALKKLNIKDWEKRISSLSS
jgi:heat shock protein HtpX